LPSCIPCKKPFFISVIGGMSFLNFLALFKPEKTLLFDINPYSIKYCRLITKIIKESKNTQDFFKTLSEGHYEVEDEDQKHMRELLTFMGRSEPDPVGPGWSHNIPDNGPLDQKTDKKRGIQLGHPLRSWKYALDHFAELKESLVTTQIKKEPLDVFSPEFNLLLNEGPAWVHFSNIFHIALKNGMNKSHSYYLCESDLTLFDETTEITRVQGSNVKLTRDINGWHHEKLRRIL
jgi:hypothetical protein